MRIVYLLGTNNILRYSELRRKLQTVTHKMLSTQLKELERDGIVIRTEYPQVPPKVEYSLSEKGKALMPIFDMFDTWYQKYC